MEHQWCGSIGNLRIGGMGVKRRCYENLKKKTDFYSMYQ